MSFEPTKVIEMDQGKQIGSTMIETAENIPYGSTTVGAELARLNSNLSTKMDSVSWGAYKLTFKAIGGEFNPAQTNGVLYYNLDVDPLGIVAMVAQTNSNLFLSTPTYTTNGWMSTINTTVNALITWRGIVFYPSN